MRVAVLLEQCLAPVPGGTGRYSRDLAAALARVAAPGDEVDGWIAAHPRGPALGPVGVRVGLTEATVPGVRGPRMLPLPRPALIKAWEHAIGPAPRDGAVTHAPTLLLPPRRRQPLVVTLHDAVPWTHPETLTPRGVVWHRRMADRAARDADLVVVPTAAVAAELGEHLPRLDPGRVRVIPEGVAADLALPAAADANARAARLDVPARGFLLTLATLEPRKGLDVALAAVAHPAAPDLPLLIAGQPGWGGVDPIAEAVRRGLAPDRVRVLGRLADPDLAVLLSRATALLAPSRAEGFGLPVLEAMSLGAPVITSDSPALVEVGGGVPLVVPRGDAAALAEAAATVASDDGLKERMSAAGRRRAGDFSWDAAAEQLWAAYYELVR